MKISEQRHGAQARIHYRALLTAALRRFKDLIPPLAGCSPNEAAAQADRLIATREITLADFTHNKATRHGLKPRAIARGDEA